MRTEGAWFICQVSLEICISPLFRYTLRTAWCHTTLTCLATFVEARLGCDSPPELSNTPCVSDSPEHRRPLPWVIDCESDGDSCESIVCDLKAMVRPASYGPPQDDPQKRARQGVIGRLNSIETRRKESEEVQASRLHHWRIVNPSHIISLFESCASCGSV